MKLIITVVFLLLAFSCESNTTEDNANFLASKTKIDSKIIGSTELSVYQDANPVIGYNSYYVEVKSAGEAVKNAELSINPLMDMGTMMHKAPLENPVSTVSTDGIYKLSTSFIMSGMWELTIHVKNLENADEGDLVIDLDVAASSMVKKVMGSDSANYYITLIYDKMSVGMNDIEFLVNKRETMMSFPAVEALTISMEPTMPSMGHGSPNNVNPSHDVNGHYKGKVNFTMSGEWNIDLLIKDSENLTIPADFDIEL
jgi:hypothetical protein